MPKRVPVQTSLLKLIQILNTVELPVHVVLGSINNFVENYKYFVQRIKAKQKIKLEMPEC